MNGFIVLLSYIYIEYSYFGSYYNFIRYVQLELFIDF